MSQRRLDKVSEVLRETVADLLLLKSKDPRLKRINVTRVKVTADLKRAHVFYSIIGDEAEKQEVKQALTKAAGFVRSSVGGALKMKYAPEIKFEFDKNLEYAQHMNDLLNSLAPRTEKESDGCD